MLDGNTSIEKLLGHLSPEKVSNAIKDFGNLEFKEPLLLLLLLVLPLLIFYYIKAADYHSGTLRYSDTSAIPKKNSIKLLLFAHAPFAMRLAAVAMLIIIIAGPQAGNKMSVNTSEGVNIQLVLDVSTSMIAEDIKPSRIDAAKDVIAEFIESRKYDRIGLVTFSTEAFINCPLTLDYDVLRSFLEQTEARTNGATAIGLGIATAVDTLKDMEGNSKVIILLTDGENNVPTIEPQDSARLAKSFGIKVYTIGMGKPGLNRVPITVSHPIFGKHRQYAQFVLNEDALQEIAQITGAQYFNAQNKESLQKIYEKIDELEKVEIKEKEYLEYNEMFYTFAFFALLFLLAEFILSKTRLAQIP